MADSGEFLSAPGVGRRWCLMAAEMKLIQGEFHCSLDERFRLSLPKNLVEQLDIVGSGVVLAKERPGAISLWGGEQWQARHEADIGILQGKLDAGRLDDRIEELRQLGRLMSTRHTEVNLSSTGRFSIPQPFRSFLGVEASGDVMVVGAAVCVEVWNPEAWVAYVGDQIPDFRQLLDELSS